MPQDTFTAGVIPGGLTAASEIKILICHVLCEIKLPISREDLLDAIAGHGYANYFESADAIADLLDTGHIAQDAQGMLLPAPLGREAAALLSSDVALTVRERVVKQALIYARRSSNQNANQARISKLEGGGYRLHCSVSDKEGEIFALDLLAPTLSDAQRMRDYFLDNAATVMQKTYAIFIDGSSMQ